jgi:PucR family transcriptional regulator, purine catabolism regulatory protein
MLTVRDLLSDLDVRLVTGDAGLDLPVRWVHITELRDPTPWLSGGEVLLTTGLQLGDEERQREFVNRLADHQLAALGFGTGFGHATVPDAVIEVASERQFPVFEVPYEVPFIAITEAAFSQLVNEQYAVLRRALAAQERLERIVLSERGLDALAGALAALIGAAVLVFDPRGELLVQHAFRRPLESETLTAIAGQLRDRARRRDARAFMPSGEDAGSSLALPVAADGAPRSGGASGVERIPEAWLVALKDAGSLSDFDRLTLHQAVTIVALELLRSRVAGDTERRLAGDVLAAVVRGELAGPELRRRLEPFGLAERVAAVVVERPGNGRGSAAPAEMALVAALRDDAAPGLVASTGGLTCALVPGMEEEELVALAERVGVRLRSELGAPVQVGVGRAVPGDEARRSFHEARCALEALALGVAADDRGANGSAGSSRIRVGTYRDLGSFQLLLSLQDDEALRLFCDSILGPIEASEGPYGGELMRSLEAFIEENGQWERAARRLYCHRHTLRYRIRRVEELTGRNLSSARDRIEFWLALRGRELVS